MSTNFAVATRQPLPVRNPPSPEDIQLNQHKRSMQLPHFLLVLLLTAATTINVTVATEGQTNSLPAGNHRFRTKDDGSVSDNNSSHVGKTEMEERGMFSSALSKVKGMFGKNTDLGNKFNVIRKNPDVVAALDNSPVLRNLEMAVEKNPKVFIKLAGSPDSLKKLSKNREVAQFASTLEKSKSKITKNDMNQLRTAIAENPSKFELVIKGLEVMGGVLTLAAMAGIAGYIIFLFVVMVLALANK